MGAKGRSLALLGAAAVALPMIISTPAAAADQSGIPGIDEVRHSWNIRQLASVPKQAPFNVPEALNTDLAFSGDKAIVGNYNGFTIYDIRNPRKPKLISQVSCPGGQNDVSVSGNLVFLSTDSSRSDNSCNSVSKPASEKDAWEGIKIFDISDARAPKYVAAVETNCGSHTHTLVPDNKSKDLYLYVSSYGPRAEFPDCSPPHDLISIIKVPAKNPAAAAIVAKPVLFPDGGNPGVGGTFPDKIVSATSGCHDITVYPSKDLAAGACMGDGILFDIKNREKPRVINQVRDNEHFAFWHSATFNNEGTKVVFTDELGGGGRATCNEQIGPERGADGVYDITGRGDNRKLEFRSYFKIPRPNAESEVCVAHNGSLIPVLGKDIMVQAWYQGGISVWDFTDSARPKEIGYWERGPVSNTLTTAGPWSTYYYNGHIYSSDIEKGFEVLEIIDPRVISAKFVKMKELNAQTQTRFW
ncbi:LVIVD repeat-containing protein [Kibdelosporangium aridum]|uniref:LVIVD repeat-containing protein n=1 Tax=Kibdelosporangium aridum TaxID=2030 RepID=A0A1Y5Y0Y6_KIBAR|nr:hypothetical protein [Kibdelosporangium aridum]SMD21917.1 LVIVD repeat-containing protein [Kibdelosporangium aridum]